MVGYPVNSFSMTLCQFLSLKISMARSFQHDPYDPHQKGLPHHRSIPIVLGESESKCFPLKYPPTVGSVFYGVVKCFRKTSRDLLVSERRTKLRLSQNNAMLKTVAISFGVEQGIEQETLWSLENIIFK